ncbi:Hypothetical predicted protein [Mytilus galloprovincialis]|uniref:B box-type domain-containing protein n=1 Tax=Mytilus galloprovincialis TaxID=29158 RepID=A0A8B6ET11_MYTGA|nr:Hypothetical predicted protein [Mytilus galloprovincialis]
MAAYTLESAEIHEDLNSTKTLRCRFHDKEECQLFCNDCKDFVCFECLGQLHQKHDICSLQNAVENIKKEIRNVLLGDNFIEQLHILSENFTEQKKELFQDEESLKRGLRSKVIKVRKQLHLSEECLLSEVRCKFKGYQTTLKEQETMVNNLRTKLTTLDVDKLNEHNLDYIMNTLSEMKLCSSTCYKHKKDQQAVFTAGISVLIENLIRATDEKSISKGSTLSNSSFSNTATQTDPAEDSDTEWFDAEDTCTAPDDLVENSSDEYKNDFERIIHLPCSMNLVNKIEPISEKEAWLLSNRRLFKIVDHSFQNSVYAYAVNDFVVLKDGCVLILSVNHSFLQKLHTDGRLLTFANVGKADRTPYCLCVSENDTLVIYLSSSSGCTDFLLFMDTDGMFISEASVSNRSFCTPGLVRLLEPYICVLYHANKSNSVQRIELLKKKR